MKVLAAAVNFFCGVISFADWLKEKKTSSLLWSALCLTVSGIFVALCLEDSEIVVECRDESEDYAD